MKYKVIRTSTVAMSLDLLLKGQLKFLNNYFHVIAVSGKDKHLINVENREGVEVKNIEMQRKISIFKDLISLFKLIVFFRKEKPTIVHSITPKAGLLTMLAAKIVGVPVRVHTFTGLVFPSRTGLLKRVLIWMDRLICYSATHVLAEGTGVKHDLIANKITLKPVQILGNGNVNGVDLDYFNINKISKQISTKLKKKLEINEDDFVFVFIGRINNEKGIDELLQAYDLLISNKNRHLILVGDTEDYKLKEYKTDKIHKVGYQNDIRPYLSVSNVLVLPSYREGFPNVVLQAASFGLPSIVTNINGSNEIVKHKYNGYICKAKDTNSLLESMQYCLENKTELEQWGIYAKKYVTSKFSNQVIWDATLKFYQKVLKIEK